MDSSVSPQNSYVAMNKIVFPPNSYVEALIPIVIVFGNRAFGGNRFRQGHEGRAFMMGLVPL